MYPAADSAGRGLAETSTAFRDARRLLNRLRFNARRCLPCGPSCTGDLAEVRKRRYYRLRGGLRLPG
jgi:hypothetical protein